jgi:cysteine desulfurase
MQQIYLDWAATSPIDPDINSEIARISELAFGNPSSTHKHGREAARYLLEARQNCASSLGCTPENIVFTSGGSEANNIALFSLLKKQQKGHIVVTGIEHPSVWKPVKTLQNLGYRVTVLKCGPGGRITPEAAAAAVEDDTILVSVMLLNNETGIIQPVEEIAMAVRTRAEKTRRRIHFHCDMVQALGKIGISLEDTAVDSASFSAHKFSGPKGFGILYTNGALEPLYGGGGQEFGLRSGTENTAAVYGTSLAVKKTTANLEKNRKQAETLLDLLIDGMSSIPGTSFIPAGREVDREHFSPFILSVAFPLVPGEVTARVMNDAGFSISTGSACSSKKKGESRVIEYMGIDHRRASSMVRISTGYTTTESAVQDFLTALKKELPALIKVASRKK